MTNLETEVEIRQLEEKLRLAMLSSNVETLEALIDDALIFVGPNGNLISKADDLHLHRTGQTTMSRLDIHDIEIAVHDHLVIATVVASVAGEFMGHAFAGRFRYLRTWGRDLHRGQPWRVVAGSVFAIAA